MEEKTKRLSLVISSLLAIIPTAYAEEREIPEEYAKTGRYCTAKEKEIALAKFNSNEPMKDLSGPIEVNLEYHKENSYLTGRYAPGGTLVLVPEELEGVAGSGHMVSTLKNLGADMKVAVAKSEGAIGYDLMFFDKNRDGKLADETPVKFDMSEEKSGIWGQGWGNTLTVTHQLKDGTTVEGYVDLLLWHMERNKDAALESVRYSCRTTASASVTLAGLKYELAVQDFTHNALLNDKSDYWQIKGKFEGSNFSGGQSLSKFLFGSKGKAWRLEMADTSGLKANIYEVEAPVTKREMDIINRRIKPFDFDTIEPVAETPIVFEKDLAKALKKAKELNTSCFIKFETTWCGPCKVLNEVVFTKQKIADAAKHVVCVKIDGDEHRDLVDKYNVAGYPTMMMVDSDGKLIQKYAGKRYISGIAEFIKSGKK